MLLTLQIAADLHEASILCLNFTDSSNQQLLIVTKQNKKLQQLSAPFAQSQLQHCVDLCPARLVGSRRLKCLSFKNLFLHSESELVQIEVQSKIQNFQGAKTKKFGAEIHFELKLYALSRIQYYAVHRRERIALLLIQIMWDYFLCLFIYT